MGVAVAVTGDLYKIGHFAWGEVFPRPALMIGAALRGNCPIFECWPVSHKGRKGEALREAKRATVP